MSAQCKHNLMRDYCGYCRDEQRQQTHVNNMFAGGLVRAVEQMELLEAECSRLRSDLAAARVALDLAARTLRGENCEDQGEAYDRAQRIIDAALAGEKK